MVAIMLGGPSIGGEGLTRLVDGVDREDEDEDEGSRREQNRAEDTKLTDGQDDGVSPDFRTDLSPK